MTDQPTIDLWYGDHQKFGHLGTPQRWANVLGRVNDPQEVQRFIYTLNDGPKHPLSLGPDQHRLANPGDFNVEIDHADLHEGDNALHLAVLYKDGRAITRDVTLSQTKGRIWPLPYHINWSDVQNIQDVAQITDGLWELTPDGVRVVEPYYDRVIALGDLSWTDYEIQTTVTFHTMRVPAKSVGDGGANVIHAALAVRWPGHDDDGKQPHAKWHPLGATAEFRINPTWQNCSWRILGGGGMVANAEADRTIQTDVPYAMKHRVTSRPDRGAIYQVKLWHPDKTEPAEWDLEMQKNPNDVQNGGALLVAHYTVVTFGNVTVVPVKSR